MLGMFDLAGQLIRKIDAEEKKQKDKEDRERRQLEREYAREERRLEREWKKEERKREQEYKLRLQKQEKEREQREFEQKKQERLTKAQRFLSEKLGIDSLELVMSRTYEKQRLFIIAVEEAINKHKDILSDSYSIQIPLLSSDGNYYLVEKKNDPQQQFSPQFRIIKEYNGEPLFTSCQSNKLPLEVRKTALHILNCEFKRQSIENNNSENLIFGYRHLKVMKCYHEKPNITAKEIEEIKELGLVRNSIISYKKEILKLARKHLPEYTDFFTPKGKNKYVYADVVPPYWWAQGMCFEKL